MPEERNWVDRRFTLEDAVSEGAEAFHRNFLDHAGRVLDSYKHHGSSRRVVQACVISKNRLQAQIFDARDRDLIDITLDYDARLQATVVTVASSRDNQRSRSEKYNISGDESHRLFFQGRDEEVLDHDAASRRIFEDILFPR
jgi:hypothetical protein